MLVVERSDLFLWMKVKDWFWNCISLLIYASFLVIVTWHFLISIFFPFLVIVTWHFHIWNLFRFLVDLYKKWKYLVFQIHLFRKPRNNQMAAVMLQVIPSFYTNFSENTLFVCANTYEKYNVNKENCFAGHDDKMCFLPNWRHHIILIGNIEELLQIGCSLFQLSTRGLSVYTFQVPLQWHKWCQKWTTLW